MRTETIEADSDSQSSTSGPEPDFEKVVAVLSRQASGLGKGSAELNGLIDDLAGMSSAQKETFARLVGEIEAMVQANRTICDLTTQSNDSVRQARNSVEKVGQAVGGVTGTLAQVAEAAREITKIASQTKLVSFNAAIESRRAGEAGRTFGVVAAAVRDLAVRIEESSEQITSTIAQLEVRIRDLALDIQSKESTDGGVAKRDSFQAAVSKVERSVGDIAGTAKKNLDGCAGVIVAVRGLSSQVAGSTIALQNARKETEGFLVLAEKMIGVAVESGIQTDDTPYIEAAIDIAGQIGAILDDGVSSGLIKLADLFSQEYAPVRGTNPQAHLARYSEYVDPRLPEYLEEIMAMSSKVVFAVATDRKGYVPMNVAKYCKPYGPDPVWNQANCRYHRFFDGRTEMAAIRSQQAFLLQTYRRNMGAGKFLVMKHLSAPILVQGQQWGALRIGLEF
jgi:methyl-accepting chemotaxis protein